MNLGPGSSRHINDAADQRLVERNVGGAEALDSLAVSECAVDSASQRDGAVLGGVMIVDRCITLCIQLQVHARVFDEGGQHVIEKPESCVHGRLAGAIEVDAPRDGNLFRLPG